MTDSTTSATTGSTFYSACALDGRSAQQLSHLREGEGGVAGFAKGGAKVSLSDKDGGTLLTYDVEAKIGGKLARLGQRLINSAAKKTADDFFVKFAAAVAQG